jgi:hypothetical protein
MRWKNIEISSFSIHNACGYTSSALQARHLPLKGKAFKCGANINYSSVERRMLFKITPFEVFGATFFQKGSKKS